MTNGLVFGARCRVGVLTFEEVGPYRLWGFVGIGGLGLWGDEYDLIRVGGGLEGWGRKEGRKRTTISTHVWSYKDTLHRAYSTTYANCKVTRYHTTTLI